MEGMFIMLWRKGTGWKPGLPESEEGCEKKSKLYNGVTIQNDLVLLSMKTNKNKNMAVVLYHLTPAGALFHVLSWC